MAGVQQQKQLTLFVTFWIQPSKIEEWKAAHRPVWEACSKEPECLLFDVFEDASEQGRFRLMEVWSKDREWFETKQLTNPYYTTLWAKSKPTYREGKDVLIEYYERLGEGCIYRKAYLEGGKLMDA